VQDTGIKEYIASNMQKIVKERSSPDHSPDGDLWIRRQAIEILGQLGLPGPEGQILSILGAVVADSNQPLPLRSAAAQAVGKIKPEALPADEANPLTRQLGALALDACRYEIDGGGDGDQQVSWPRLAVSLGSVNDALAVVEAFADADGKAFSARVKDSISNISTALGEVNMSNEQRKRALAEKTAAVESIVNDETEGGETIEEGAGEEATPDHDDKPRPAEPPADFDEF
jgi:hypothetical protein